MEGAGGEEVLLGVEAALALEGVLEAAPPRGRRREHAGRAHRDGHPPRVRLPSHEARVARVDLRLEAHRGGLLRVVVEVPEGAEGPQREQHRAGRLAERVAHDGGVLPLHHEHRPLEPQARRGEGPRGDRVEREGRDASPPVGVHGAREGVRRELDGAPAHVHRLVEVRHEHVPAARGREGRDEEAVVAPRRDARDGARGEAAEAVGDEPLAGRGGREVAREGVEESDHGRCRRRAETLMRGRFSWAGSWWSTAPPVSSTRST